MATYKDIKRQIADLEKKAVEARKAELSKVIASIKAQIAEYDLTPADLFKGSLASGVKVAKAATKSVKPANPPKYMDPKNGKTWTGHGKSPAWIAGAIKKGTKDDFLIAKVMELRAVKAQAKVAKDTAPKKAVKPVAKAAAAGKKAQPKTKAPAVKKAVAAPAQAPAPADASAAAAVRGATA